MSGLLSTAEEVINQARDGEQLEAYVSRGSSTEVKVYGGEVESFTSATSAGIGIRVIRDGRVGFAHAGTLEPDVVSETLAEARDNLAFSEPDEWVEMAEPDDGTPIVHDHWADSVAETETETKIQMAMELEEKVLAADERVTGVRTAMYSDSTGETVSYTHLTLPTICSV